MAPDEALRVRATLAQLNLSGWELERIDRRYSGDARRISLG